MPACAKSVFLLLLFCAVPICLLAQQNEGTPTASYRASGLHSALGSHTLTLDEGLAVLGAALDSRHQRGFTSDCSHFVHGLYEHAGFPYAYASSAQLYSGIDQFRRVTTPQSGDLVVWLGHVGIVVNPVQHSFFSLLRSGAGVEFYDSPYWKRRGHPRFFRYVEGNPGTALATSLRNASLKPTDGESYDSSETAADNPGSNRDGDFSAVGERRHSRIGDAQAPGAISAVVIINSVHPTPDQVRAAYLQSCTDSEERLRVGDIFRSARTVVVFDRFVVRKLHLSGTQGWVEVEIGEVVSVTAGKSEAHSRVERQRWPFVRRAHATWELTPPQEAMYVPQNIAAHLTAEQLAQLTQDGGSSDQDQKTELAQLLNMLLQK